MEMPEDIGQVPHVDVFTTSTQYEMLLFVFRKMIDLLHT